jgi:hypothetical protein
VDPRAGLDDVKERTAYPYSSFGCDIPKELGTQESVNQILRGENYWDRNKCENYN